MSAETLRVIIPGAPFPKPRMTQRDKWRPSERVQFYRAWADLVRLSVTGHLPAPLRGPLCLVAYFYLPVPPSWPAWRRANALAGKETHTSKPDLKNLIAGLEDALNGLAWGDDAQVASYFHCVKRYDDGSGPRTELFVMPYDDSLVHGPDKTSTQDRELAPNTLDSA